MTMRSFRRSLFFPAIAAILLAGPACRAAVPEGPPRISDGVVKIGLILDLSGPYSDATGIGSATAAKMAVEDFGGRVLGAPIAVVVADHKNSPDRAADIAREWFTKEHVDAIMDVSGSSAALIVQAIGSRLDKIVSLSAPGAERLSNEACTATSVHYVFTTRAIANTVGAALVRRGYDSWFFITVDYSFGFDLEHDTQDVVEEHGGRVVGGALYPLDAEDFTSYLARARDSGAKVIGLANAGTDVERTVRQAAGLGMIPGRQLFAALDLRINSVHALGLRTTQGMVVSTPFYWDMNAAARSWSKRFFARLHKMPNSLQTGVYSSTMHYLRAVARAGTDATGPVMQAMRAMPIDDFFAHGGHIRADGTMVHPMYLFQVKAPSQSHYPWDYYKLLATVPGEEAFGPLSQSKCPLVHR
jgi:branched-chain amino acid transport system substrate-binding protein